MNRLVTYMLFGLLVATCANPVPPQGGDVDTQPPQIILEESTPNEQVNFSPKVIEFEFDEWIKLKDIKKQLLVSPPLEFDPVITNKGKRLVIELHENEVLRPNTTYTFQFGESIIDITEGNPASELKFIFSTGPKLDSLQYKGIVEDAKTGDPVEGVTIMLYEELNDSIPYKERPAYVTKTKSNGEFALTNLKAGVFKIFALQDKDLNYLFNSKNELIAYSKLPINTTDSIPFIALRLFQEEAPLKIQDKIVTSKRVNLIFNRTSQISEFSLSPTDNTLQEYYQDSVVVFFREKWDSLQVITNAGDDRDTSIIRPPRKKVVDTMGVMLSKVRPSNIVIDKNDSFFLSFNNPLISLDTSMVDLKDTSSSLEFSYIINPKRNRQLGIIAPWQSKLEYTIRILPGAIIDFWGNSNKDTIIAKFKTLSKESVGNITIKIVEGQPDVSYIIQLRKGSSIIESEIVGGGINPLPFVYKKLIPGEYEIKIIKDDNGNGRWDSGNYLGGLQPEHIYLKKLEPLRKNWELEVTVNLSDAIKN